MPSPTPETLGRYTLLSCISVGHTTEIHKARAEGVGGFRRTFALKRVRPELASRPGLVDQLVDEARTTGLLSHANIVQIMDLGEEGGTYTVAMEHVDGPDLARVLARCTERGIRLPVPHTVFITLELLKALDYAHTRTVMRGDQPQPLGIVHLAIAPENLLMSWQGEVKLTDFGCARTTARALAPPPTAGAPAGYASPEVAGSGAAVDARADLFSAGVMLYEMLTGRHPFRGRSATETRAALRRGGHARADQVLPEVPAALARIVDQALAVDPRRRFASAAAMKEALDGFLHDAGFVIGPAGLATFLRQLFPASGSAPLRPPTGLARPRRSSMDADPVTHPMGEDADARPTTIAPPAPAPARRPRPLLDDRSVSKAFGPLPSAADESTLVKSVDVMAMAAAAEWGDAPTRIRGAPTLDPAAAAGDDDEDLLLPDPEDDGRPTVARPPRAAAPSRPAAHRPPPTRPAPRPAPAPPATPAPRAPSPGSPSPRAPGPAGRTGVALWLAVGAIGAVLVLGVGVLLGIQLSKHSTAQRDPLLQIQAPTGARVELDGAAVQPDAPLPVAAGPHTVGVIRRGAPRVEVEVTLDPGEHRILTFQAAPTGAGDTP